MDRQLRFGPRPRRVCRNDRAAPMAWSIRVGGFCYAILSRGREACRRPDRVCEVAGIFFAAKRHAAVLACAFGRQRQQRNRLTFEPSNCGSILEAAFWCEDLSTMRSRARWGELPLPGVARTPAIPCRTGKSSLSRRAPGVSPATISPASAGFSVLGHSSPWRSLRDGFNRSRTTTVCMPHDKR